MLFRSAGLAAQAVGLPLKRWQATMVDGAIAILGLIYVLFIDSGAFFANLNSYIILAIAWVGPFGAVWLADMWWRRWHVRPNEAHGGPSSPFWKFDGPRRAAWIALVIGVVGALLTISSPKFNGPIAKEVGLNSGNNVMGNYFRANAVIGRAVRLALVNIGAAIPGTGDMATAGTPAKFTFCVAENEDASPWEPLHVEMGLPKEATAVTVVAAESPHNVNDHESITPEGILTMCAGTMANTGSNNAYYDGQPVMAFGPEHAQTVASGGMKKPEVKQWLWERATLPMSKFSKEGIERRFRRKLAEKFANAPLDTPVHMWGKPEDLIIVVTGGAGKHSQWVPTFGNTRAATRALRRADGELVLSVEDLKRG